MDDWQLQFINENLDKLVQTTKCSSALLDALWRHTVLDEHDVKALENEGATNGDTAGVSKLYAMLPMRDNSYEVLISALQRTNQFEPAEILQNGLNSHNETIKSSYVPLIFPNKNDPKLDFATIITKPDQRPLKHQKKKNSISVYASIVASSLFTSLFFAVYLIYYIDLSLVLSISMSSAIGILILLINVKVKFFRATILLVAPELTARTTRIAFVHILMILSPLPHLQNNSEQFMSSMVCTTEKALNVAKNSTEGVLRNAMGGVQGSIQAINELSNQIEKVISGPLDAFGNIIVGAENVIREIGRMKQHCESATAGVTNACGSVLSLPGGTCDGILNGRRRKRGIGNWFGNLGNTIKDGVNSGVNFVGGGINTGVNTVVGGVNTGVNTVVGGVNTGVNTVVGGVNTGVNTITDGVRTACNSMRGVSSHCQQIRNSNMCNVFSKINPLEGKIQEFRKTATQGVKDKFAFKLEVKHGANASANEESFVEIKDSFQEKVQSKIDFFLAFKRIWGMILSLSVVYLLIRKMLLVRNYLDKKPIKCKLVSLFFLITNPFTLQICFLFLIGTLDYSFYLIHTLFREAILENEISLGVDFNASITATGGSIGKGIANGIIKAFELNKSVKETVSFEECFEVEVEPPNFLNYLLAVGVSAIGIVTYVVYAYSRRRQKELIQFAYNNEQTN